MADKETYIIPLKDLKDGITEYEFHLDNEFFEMVDGPEIQRGDLKALVTVVKHAESFGIDFDIQGIVNIPCDRCLDDMEQEIDTQEHLNVKYGDDPSEETDTLVVVPESEGVIDISWYMYEFAALNIPMRHVHPEGQCNQEMASRLANMMTNTESESNEDKPDDRPIDPRWEALKKLKN